MSMVGGKQALACDMQQYKTSSFIGMRGREDKNGKKW